ncbi:MAG: hypothetical protein ACM3O9_05105 [Methylocystaceae bacterium]
MRGRHYLVPLLMVVFILLGSSGAQAVEWGEVLLKEGQQGPLFLTGTQITADTNILGDVYLIGEEIHLGGDIKGDVFCLAQKVIIDGKVDGDVRVIAGEMELNGSCTGSVTALGDSFWLWQEASCGNLFVATGSAQLNGTVNGSLRGQTDTMYINGTVTGKTDLRANSQLSIGSKAILQGGLVYESPAKLKTEKGASISGTTHYKSIAPPKEKGVNLTAVLISWLSAMVAWWLAGVLKPSIWQNWGYSLASHPWTSLFLGSLALLALPPLLVLLMFSIVGIPAALMLVAMTVIVGYLGRVVVAVGIGIYMVRSAKIKPAIAIMIALIPLILLTYLPGVGVMFMLSYACLGLGSLLYNLRFNRRGRGIDQII